MRPLNRELNQPGPSCSISLTAQSLVSSLSSFVAAGACTVSSRRMSLRRRLSTGADDEAWTTAVMLATDDISTSVLLSAVAGEPPATVVSENVMLAGRRIASEDALGAHTCAAHDCPNRSRRPAAAMAMPIVNISLNGTVALDMQLQYTFFPRKVYISYP